MKFKNLVIMVMALGLFVGTVGTSSAAFFADATVEKATTLNGVTTIALSGLPGQTIAYVWCSVPAASNDAALAVALTAMSLVQDVRVTVLAFDNAAETCSLSAIGLSK